MNGFYAPGDPRSMEHFFFDQRFFLKLSIMLVPALMAITFHEVSHGFVADRLGDRTARLMGRLTLNPLKHLDFLGTLMIFIVHFGWAKPVPVNFHNLRNPKRDMIWVAGAGPVTNFSLAIICAVILRLLAFFGELIPGGTWVYNIWEPMVLMVAFSVYINVLLAVFNLIPIPPLDGGRVAVGLLPNNLAEMLARLEPYGFIILIVLLFLTPLFTNIIKPIVYMIIKLMAGPQASIIFSVESLIWR